MENIFWDKTIPEPFLNKENKDFCEFLKKKGIKNITWCVYSNLDGYARSSMGVNKENIIITFKEEGLKENQCLISHELLHQVLFIKGLPKIVTKKEFLDHIFCKKSIVMLNMVFDHIIMEPLLRKLNCPSILKEEVPMIEKNINELNDFIKKNIGDRFVRRLVNFFYIRAKISSVEEDKLKEIKKILKNYNLYDNNIITIIKNNLPQPNCKIEGCRELKKKCFRELELDTVAQISEW